jgi:hypothetical protein
MRLSSRLLSGGALATALAAGAALAEQPAKPKPDAVQIQQLPAVKPKPDAVQVQQLPATILALVPTHVIKDDTTGGHCVSLGGTWTAPAHKCRLTNFAVPADMRLRIETQVTAELVAQVNVLGSIENAGRLVIGAFPERHAGGFTIGGTLVNRGSIRILSGGSLHCYTNSYIKNHGELESHGTLDLDCNVELLAGNLRSRGMLTLDQGSLAPGKQYPDRTVNDGRLLTEGGASLWNHGSAVQGASTSVGNRGRILNFGTYQMKPGGSFSNFGSFRNVCKGTAPGLSISQGNPVASLACGEAIPDEVVPVVQSTPRPPLPAELRVVSDASGGDCGLMNGTWSAAARECRLTNFSIPEGTRLRIESNAAVRLIAQSPMLGTIENSGVLIVGGFPERPPGSFIVGGTLINRGRIRNLAGSRLTCYTNSYIKNHGELENHGTLDLDCNVELIAGSLHNHGQLTLDEGSIPAGKTFSERTVNDGKLLLQPGTTLVSHGKIVQGPRTSAVNRGEIQNYGSYQLQVGGSFTNWGGFQNICKGTTPGLTIAQGNPVQAKPCDADGDGIGDGFDQCLDAKETLNGVMDNDGCPDATGSGP